MASCSFGPKLPPKDPRASFDSWLLGLCQDERLKVIGGDNIEGLLISSKQLPYKYLEFLQNQGHLVGVLNDNDIQVWNLETRSLICSLQWESNITAFSVISGSHFIYVGDEHGLFSVIKFDAEEGQLLKSSNHLLAKFLREAAGFPESSEKTRELASSPSCPKPKTPTRT
ncbi:hypothetical protein KIW84_034081 [Lathyrus oleraceus]|uniref:Uncharacterized protein n=1 Tax=Pisum sativum TaxID=3888 RepID=A0A9D4XYM4_PEA|nr:hypothetical protein KIW84_034081 [Pisum sativum]